MKRLIIRNLKTSQEYPITEDGWNTLREKGWSKHFTIVEEQELTPGRKASYMPPEVAKALNIDIEESIKEEQPARKRNQQRDHA